jgi:adenylate kinase
MCPRVIALTGSPGTGKSTLAEALKQHGLKIIRLEDIAKEADALANESSTNIIETSKLSEWVWSGDEPCIIDGHLSHYCTIDAVIILRCAPNVLRQRLKQRQGYGHEKIESNVEWELIAGTWTDLVNLHPEIGVLEIDTTNQSIDVERVLRFLANGDGDGSVQDAIHRAQDWMNAGDIAESI